MFGIDKEEEGQGQEQDAKSQVLQEILDFAQSKMLGKMKGKAVPVGMEVSIESPDSPEGMEAEEAKEGYSGSTCPHCGKEIGGKAC
jgi:hypothetical protein